MSLKEAALIVTWNRFSGRRQMTAVTTSPVIGLVGLGAMGMGSARAMLEAGLDVIGCDISPGACQAFDAAGGARWPRRWNWRPSVRWWCWWW
ncbi:NAD(P)-binding domain-containing protein [Cobetia marina]